MSLFNNNTTSQSNTFKTASVRNFLHDFNLRLERLAEKLLYEQELLISGQADEISQAAQDKLLYMQELSDDITRYLDIAPNITADKQESLTKSLNTLHSICLENKIKEWDETLDSIQYCRDLSDDNHTLLANRLKSTNSAIDILFTLSGTPKNKTYDDRGISKYSHSSRQLASI